MRIIVKNWQWTLLAFAASIGFFLWVTPLTFLNNDPATGGDTSSHFYSFWVMMNHGLRAWSPGNLMGEPILLHYFPGPFLVMGFIALFSKIGFAYNVGTILPIATFPFTVWVGMRGLGYRMSVCFLGMAASLVALFHEANSMWGGNAVSLLAGQFAHMYALNFLMLTIGCLGYELRTGKKYYSSALLMSFVAVCHSYVFMFVPLVLLSFWLAYDFGTKKERFIYIFKIGIGSLLASAWFTVPQISNNPWVTKAPLTWYFTKGGLELIPLEFALLLCGLLVFFPYLTYQAGAGVLNKRRLLRESIFWLVPVLGCAAMFFILPKIGLVDVRVVPQAHLFLAMFTAVVIGISLEYWPIKDLALMTLSLCILLGVLTKREISNYPHWVRWNYGGWKSKEKFPQAQHIFDFVRGDFNQPRIANEHNPDLGQTGSPRVFELLPYFANRASMESLYAEATHTAFITTDIQGRISKSPSCPIRNVPCPTLDTQSLPAKMRILGLRDLILMTPEAIAAVTKSGDFQKIYMSDMFKIYQLQGPISLVDVLTEKPNLIESKDWQKNFREWYTSYDGSKPPLVVRDSELTESLFTDSHFANPSECHPQMKVDFNSLQLNTDCPGKWHIMKFTYHPAWQVDSKDPLFLISPGFMLISPSQNVVTMKFGPTWLWRLSTIVSIFTFLAWAASRLKFNLLSSKKNIGGQKNE